MRFVTLLVAAVWPLSTLQGRAEETACSAFAWPLAREFALLAGSALPAEPSGGGVRAGDAARIELRPLADVAFPMQPERLPRRAGSFGGFVILDAPARAGLYQITLSAEAWVDVVQNGVRLRSVAFSGKPGCPGMRKSVRFDLQPLPATIQISGASEASINIVATPAE